MKNSMDIAKTLIKVVEDSINDIDIRLPKVEKQVWLGNYCINIKTGGKKKNVKR